MAIERTQSISKTIVAEPDLRHLELEIEQHLKQEHGIKLDSDQQLCPRHLRHLLSTNSDQQHQEQEPPCQLGTQCPFRHSTPSILNFTNTNNPGNTSSNNRNHHSHAKTVCKHWLRGLCKKGNSCEFLHEYNLRTMPECWFFGKYGFCSNGDECMYLHVDDRMRVLECMDFRRGFCPKGPDCAQKHIRRPICKLYLVGFCPYERSCKIGGHPKFEVDPSPRGNPYINSFNPFDRPRPENDRPIQNNNNYNNNHLKVQQQAKHHHQHHQQPQVFLPPHPSQTAANTNPLNHHQHPHLIQHQMKHLNNNSTLPPIPNHLHHPMLSHPPPHPPTTTMGANTMDQTVGNNIPNEHDHWVQTDSGPRKKRNLDEVTCFKCGQRGHYANTCPNPMVPGNRGGVVRGPGGRLLGDDDLLPVL
ncbi:hypothetical protein MJO29_003649 [Puccinia striiformis f. sp. tritici]|nr:hypothetical protein Pst134EB_007919 [Puccinia striiformis f. sp. tritici]KAI7963222.1 hypothetical protein MJO29_003649 [Puccinia striiformis f. sp. tritici]